MIRRALRTIFSWALALLILFEEWGWEPLGRLLARLARLPIICALELRIQSLPPYASLAVFLAPTLALVPVKLAALWLIAQGHAFTGIAIIVLAKVSGTAVMARLFTLTQPALMKLEWFAGLYLRWTAWKDAMFERVRSSAAWRSMRAAKARLRAALNRIKFNFSQKTR